LKEAGKGGAKVNTPLQGRTNPAPKKKMDSLQTSTEIKETWNKKKKKGECGFNPPRPPHPTHTGAATKNTHKSCARASLKNNEKGGRDIYQMKWVRRNKIGRDRGEHQVRPKVRDFMSLAKKGGKTMLERGQKKKHNIEMNELQKTKGFPHAAVKGADPLA